MKENNISRLIKCQQCEKLFYNNADAKAHKTRVHEYGEFYNLYPCKECGFMGGDATEIEEHSRNHRQYKTKLSKQIQRSQMKILIFPMEILLLTMTQMQMKTGSKQKKMKSYYKMTWKKMTFLQV